MKGMNLSAHSNILGNIVNALEMILINPRAVNFICQCFKGKNWSIPYLAVCSLMVIPELIWGRCTYMIFIKFSQNVYMGISSESYTFYMTMLSRQNMVNTIFGCMWQKCHTLANLGWMYLCDFYTIFRKCYFEYMLSKTVTKIGVTRFV